MDDLDFGTTIKGFSPGQKVLNRYTLERILGRGGMGVVWLARDEELERHVALKFLPEVVALDNEAVTDLKRETRRNLDLTHPHIVRIHDFVSDQRTAAIAMEYVDGATLAAMKLQQPGRIFSVATLEPWVKQLVDALHYAHTKAKVVHRDLKPANLMVTREGDLKITDFGIATSITDSVSRVSKQAGSSGTPVYMSPQQMMGEKPAVTDDIYALGATLYELLTSKPPFHSGNVLLQVQNKIPPSIAERRRELEATSDPVPPEWEAAIAACLAKEPAARPRTVEELWQRLARPGKPVDQPAAPPAAAVAPVASTPAPPKKSRAPLVAGLAAGVLVLGGLGWYFGLYAPEQKRLAEIQRLEAEGQAAEALKLKNERERAEAAAKEKAEQERALAARLAAARGGVIVRSNPAGAEVTVGALEHGAAPVTLKDVKLGKYPVKARLAGYEDWSGEVEVKENEFAEVNIELARVSGLLALSAEGDGVEAEVRARDGGGRTQRVNLPATITLPVGRYELAFHRAGWLDQTKTVEITRNQRTAAAADYRGARRVPEWYGTAKVGELLAAAQAGDLEARVRLGDHYFLGLDGPLDIKRAYDQYQQAVAAKYPAAYRRLALLLTSYLIGPEPYVRSIELLREGARSGDPMSVLAWKQRTTLPRGMKDTSPDFTASELASAFQKVQVLAQQGDIFAIEQLALHYGNGMGVAKNEAESRRWRKEGAERGSARCMTLYASTLLTDKNANEALGWLNKAVALDCDMAAGNLAALYRAGEQVTADKAKGFALLRQASARGCYLTMGALALAYETGDGVTADPAESLRWRQKAAESGDPFYFNALAQACLKGVGGPADPARAAALYRRSADSNDRTGLYQLGLLCATGNGVAQNEAQAIEYFRRAAQLNYSPAQDELKKRNLTW